MKPDYDRAATLAMQTLIKNRVTETPVDSLSILLKYPGVRVMSFTRFAMQAGIEREDMIPLFGENQDAATFHLDMNIKGVKYVVVYNQRLPFDIIWRGVARELGHIVLGHDGQTRSTEVRMAEAMCFAHHLISPRPVLRMLQDAVPLTMNVLTATTGCSDECVEDLRLIPGAKVPAELNRKVKALFERGINEYISFNKASKKKDNSCIIDFGSYMEGYEE